MKKCNKCGIEYKENSNSQKYCLKCRKIIRKEQQKKADKTYREKHPERVKETKHNNYLKHPWSQLTKEEKEKHYKRKRISYGKDLINSRKNQRIRYDKWVSTEHGRLLHNQKNYRRRVKEKLIMHNFTANEWLQKKKETNGICPVCGKKTDIESLTLDHIIPISKVKDGTIYGINDVQPLCKSCNCKKGNS